MLIFYAITLGGIKVFNNIEIPDEKIHLLSSMFQSFRLNGENIIGCQHVFNISLIFATLLPLQRASLRFRAV